MTGPWALAYDDVPGSKYIWRESYVPLSSISAVRINEGRLIISRGSSSRGKIIGSKGHYGTDISTKSDRVHVRLPIALTN